MPFFPGPFHYTPDLYVRQPFSDSGFSEQVGQYPGIGQYRQRVVRIRPDRRLPFYVFSYKVFKSALVPLSAFVAEPVHEIPGHLPEYCRVPGFQCPDGNPVAHLPYLSAVRTFPEVREHLFVECRGFLAAVSFLS